MYMEHVYDTICLVRGNLFCDKIKDTETFVDIQ